MYTVYIVGGEYQIVTFPTSSHNGWVQKETVLVKMFRKWTHHGDRKGLVKWFVTVFTLCLLMPDLFGQS